MNVLEGMTHQALEDYNCLSSNISNYAGRETVRHRFYKTLASTINSPKQLSHLSGRRVDLAMCHCPVLDLTHLHHVNLMDMLGDISGSHDLRCSMGGAGGSSILLEASLHFGSACCLEQETGYSLEQPTLAPGHRWVLGWVTLWLWMTADSKTQPDYQDWAWNTFQTQLGRQASWTSTGLY